MTDTTDDELIQIDQCIDTWSKKMASSSDFQRLHNAISTNLAKINSHTTDVENLVQKIGTAEDSEPLRERYLRLQNETKQLMQQTNDALQQLKDIRVSTEADQRKKRTLTESLPKQYLAVFNRFQEAQRLGVRKEKESLERARAVSYHHHQGIGDSQFSDGFPSYIPHQQQQQQQVVLPMETDVDMQALRERDDQLRQLESNIVQVNELFKDVAQLVHEQGGIIDSIENHVNTAETQVVGATQNLGKAVVYQSAARRKKIILILILIVVLVVVGLILFFTLRK